MPYSDITPTIGSDPELFIYKIVDGEKKLIPADKVLPSKLNKAFAGSGYVFFDGVQAELNPDCSSCREIHNNNIHRLLRYIHTATRLATQNSSNILLSASPCIDVNLKDLEGCDEECFRFGCAPSTCIYPMPKVKYPDGHEFTKRFAGGHIHIGIDDFDMMRKFNNPDKLESIIKMCDLFGGILGTAICFNKQEKTRRKYYGQAGTYRIQKHGIEYRTLSNFWLVSPEMASLMTGMIRDAVRYTYGDEEEKFFSQVDMEEVQKIINKVDNKRAEEIYRDVILPKYKRRTESEKSPLTNPNVVKVVDHLIEVGCDKVFDLDRMANYWTIERCSYKLYPYEGRSTRGINWFSDSIKKGTCANGDSNPASKIDYDIVYNQG